MICIIGNKGNMGRRYSEIFKWLGMRFIGVDAGEKIPDADKYICATPTDTHIQVLELLPSKSHVLCEKPICKNIHQLKTILEKMPNLTMVNNWGVITGAWRYVEHVVYDYYNTGKDGFWWDLIQPLYFSSVLTAGNKSPYFICQIDGNTYTQKDFDKSYISMIRAWLDFSHLMGQNAIIEAHEKAQRSENERLGFHSGKIDIDAASK